jgi:NAD-dependent deacetylase
MNKKNIVVITGAGISAESGLKTFRDADGLWENHKISEIATPEAWKENPLRVLNFYNIRRKQVLEANPNAAHYSLKKLEAYYNVKIITQNIDDLHERAGSTSVTHLHGTILYGRGENNMTDIFKVPEVINLGDKTSDGQQIRPHVVWFGEDVPLMEEAITLVENCNILIVIGTSLNVFPAANLALTNNPNIKKYLVDPNEIDLGDLKYEHFKGSATEKVPLLVDFLIKESNNT